MISIVVLLAYCAVFFIPIGQPLLFAQFAIGVVIGFCVIYLDRILTALVVAPEEEFSLLVEQQVNRGSLIGLFRLLYQAEGLQRKLVTRSIFFIGSYILLAVFVLTSTGSLFGSGLILGMGLRYCLDMWGFFHRPQLFAQQFLSEVRYDFAARDIRRMIAAWIVGFAAISIWLWL